MTPFQRATNAAIQAQRLIDAARGLPDDVLLTAASELQNRVASLSITDVATELQRSEHLVNALIEARDAEGIGLMFLLARQGMALHGYAVERRLVNFLPESPAATVARVYAMRLPVILPTLLSKGIKP